MATAAGWAERDPPGAAPVALAVASLSCGAPEVSRSSMAPSPFPGPSSLASRFLPGLLLTRDPRAKSAKFALPGVRRALAGARGREWREFVDATHNPGELQSRSRRGQARVFGQRFPAYRTSLSRKTGQSPDFAVLLPTIRGPLTRIANRIKWEGNRSRGREEGDRSMFSGTVDTRAHAK
jgi:hypothetical protein